MRDGPQLVATALLLVVTASCGGRATAVSTIGEVEAVGIPHTIERVWQRREDDGGFKRLANAAGDLTLTEQAIEYVTRKRSESIPWADVRVVSFGKMKGDVNTDWVVLAIGDDPTKLVGFRDGTGFGYGPRTGEIYEALRRVARDKRFAQYAVPPDLVAYDVHHRQIVLGHPAAWHVSTMSTVVSEGAARFGRTLFTPEPIHVGGTAGDPPALEEDTLARAETGRMPALILVRTATRKAKRCEHGIARKAQAQVVAVAENDPLLGGVLGEWEVEPAEIGRCRGLRLRAHGGGSTAEALAVAHAGVLYLVGFRAPDEAADETRKLFEQVVESARLSVAL